VSPFSVGQCVLVVALKRHGAIVDVRGEQYRVAVGSVTMTCRPGELRAEAPGKGHKGEGGKQGEAREKGTRDAGREGAPRVDGGTSSIDLHGFTTDDAAAALLAHIDAALRAGHAVVEVVHGVGKGRVRAVVLDTLAKIPSVERVQPHPTNRGVTRVYL
jgi:dsDNA-specific endonuclease/ATPase MutS2